MSLIFLLTIGSPNDREIEEISQKIVYKLKSINKTDFKAGQAASKLRGHIGGSLGISVKKVLSIQLMDWLEMGSAVEIRRFRRLFQEWKRNSDQPMRIILLAAILGSSVHDIITEHVQSEYYSGMPLLLGCTLYILFVNCEIF